MSTMSKTNGSSEGVLRVPCEVYSRIVGYIRPVQAWNQGKQQEWSERKTFRVPDRREREDGKSAD